MNGVAMARHGLILNHNEATGSRKVSRYLPGLRDAIKKSKITAKVQTSQNPVYSRISVLSTQHLSVLSTQHISVLSTQHIFCKK